MKLTKQIIKPVTAMEYDYIDTWAEASRVQMQRCTDAGLIEGVFVVNVVTGKVGVIKSFCVNSFSVERRVPYAYVYTSKVNQECPANELRVITPEQYNKEDQRLKIEIESLKHENFLLSKKLDEYVSVFHAAEDKYGGKEIKCIQSKPCLHARVGLCDGECDSLIGTDF